MENKHTINILDILFCFIFIPLILVFIPSADKWISRNLYFLPILLSFLYGAYFINSRILVPRLLFQKKIILYLLCLAGVTYAISLLFSFPVIGLPQEVLESRRIKGIINMRKQFVWFLYIVIMMFSIITSILHEFYKRSIEKQAIEIEKNKAELALYRSQINPHFLFNTLNTLYGLIITGSDKAENVLIKITDILHYMYTDAAKETIPLKNEYVYIDHFIKLQEYRTSSNVTIDYSFTYKNEELHIAPMILITFIENCFKYGLSATEPCLITIKIKEEEGELLFTSVNKNYKTKDKEKVGIGIENCKKRLNSIYPHKYSLNIEEVNENYCVKLRLKLK